MGDRIPSILLSICIHLYASFPWTTHKSAVNFFLKKRERPRQTAGQATWALACVPVNASFLLPSTLSTWDGCAPHPSWVWRASRLEAAVPASSVPCRPRGGADDDGCCLPPTYKLFRATTNRTANHTTKHALSALQYKQAEITQLKSSLTLPRHVTAAAPTY